MRNRTFRAGAFGRSGTYTCACCGKRTRDTGIGEGPCELCAFCYERAGLDNALADGHIDQKEYDDALAMLKGSK